MPLGLKEEIKKLIQDGTYTCCVVRDDKIVYNDTKRGIAPLMYINDNEPDTLNGSLLFDKIIGRAAAMIAIKLKAKYVYGKVMSMDALNMFKNAGIEAEYTENPKIIMNRENTGMCPIEDSVKDIKDDQLNEGIKAIRDRIDLLKSKGIKK